ncbi:MAG: sensor domain-containing diguanylate cyclase [bacterium]|nr:sensor domain-containing diguanylate cyclase [bacterium]
MEKQKLLSVFKDIPVILLQVDKKGIILDILLLNEPPKSYSKSLIGKNLSDIFPDEITENLQNNLQYVPETQGLKEFSFNLTIEQSLFFFKTYMLPIKRNTFILALHNITYYKNIESKEQKYKDIIKEHAQLLSLFDSIDHIIYVTDMDTYEILYVNKALQNRIGYPLVGKLCYKEFQNLDSPCPFCTNHIIKNSNYQPYYWEFHNKKLKAYFHITDRVIKWPDGRDVRFELAIDITKQKELEKELKILASTDELTGVWNRRYFIHQGNHEFERAIRYNIPFSLILIDVDRFKRINDSYGHIAGDTVIKKISNIILKNLRELDVCARIGGDEFGIILPNTEISGAEILAERLRIIISKETFKYEAYKIKSTISIGLTGYKKEISSFEEMFKLADSALYEAKERGRNITISKHY